MKTILLYSQDLEFCLCFTMLLQDRYNVMQTTDQNNLLMDVRSLKPDLLIADAVPTNGLLYQFEMMKREDPRLKIILFYVSQMTDAGSREKISKSVASVFHKPIDVGKVTELINVSLIGNE